MKRPHLRALRLSSPRFAYLDLIRKILFDGIQFVATPEHLEHLARADISQIAPFVKTITFVAPPKCWPLTFEGFREMVLAQAIQKYASDPHNWNGMGSYASYNDGHQRFIKQQWNGKFPLPNDQIRVGFEKYHDDALAAKDVLFGEELRATWTNALRTLPNVHNLRFTSPEYDEFGHSHLPVQPDCVIRPHRHDQSHRHETCWRVAAPVGDALFAVGIACLAEANVKGQSLDVACAMTGQFGWETLSGWEKLDLSHVQTFTFQPQVQSTDEDLGDLIAERAADTVAVVLKKCGGSLEKFTYENVGHMQWPGDEVINLPKLRDLTLGGGSIRPGNLRTWMAKMPSLQHFQLDYIDLGEHMYTGWLDVFDAIRNHPKGMSVHFNQIAANDGADISLCYHTDAFEERLEDQEAEDPVRDLNRSLSLYLSGKIEYNATLRAWLSPGD